MSKPEDILAAVRRSDRAIVSQFSQSESLDFGVAYWSPDFPNLPEANQLRDVWLADMDGPTAFARAEQFFNEHGAKCLTWIPAPDQSIEPVAATLTPLGWTKQTHTAFCLTSAPADPAPIPNLRILPARAMPKAFRQTFADETSANAATERLNDANYESFVATLDGHPAARGSLLEVTDIARVADLFVLPAMRRKGVGRAVLAHLNLYARRLMTRTLVTAAPTDDATAQTFLTQCGFTAAGTTVEFRRSPA